MSQADDLFRQAQKWREERARILAARRDAIAAAPCRIPEELYDPEDGAARFPLAWHRGQLVVLRPSSISAPPHRFGGVHEGEWRGLPRGCRPSLALHLQPGALGLGIDPSSPIHASLPLFHPFRSSENPRMLYRCEPDGSCVAVETPPTNRSDRDWPYPDFPDEFPRVGLEPEGPYPVPYLALLPQGTQRTLSVQDLPEESEQFMAVLLPARESVLGVSLLGADAEEEGAQIVFLVNPDTGAIWTFNQCW